MLSAQMVTMGLFAGFQRAALDHAINDIIWHSLQSADVPSTKEPSCLLRTDGKRPDGAILIPWSAGKYMAWDATVVHTCAASYLSQTAISPGSAAVQAANWKALKYAACFPASGYRDSGPT